MPIVSFNMNIVSAARIGDLCAVQECEECGQDINATYKNERTALYWASVKKHVSMVRWLLERGADTEGWGWDLNLPCTVLIQAARQNSVKIVMLLIQHGAQIAVQDVHGWTALSCAACNGYLDVVTELVQHGTQINLQEKNGRTSLWWAVDSRHWDVVSELLQNKEDINLCDNHRNSPPHRASM